MRRGPPQVDVQHAQNERSDLSSSSLWKLRKTSSRRKLHAVPCRCTRMSCTAVLTASSLGGPVSGARPATAAREEAHPSLPHRPHPPLHRCTHRDTARPPEQPHPAHSTPVPTRGPSMHIQTFSVAYIRRRPLTTKWGLPFSQSSIPRALLALLWKSLRLALS